MTTTTRPRATARRRARGRRAARAPDRPARPRSLSTTSRDPAAAALARPHQGASHAHPLTGRRRFADAPARPCSWPHPGPHPGPAAAVVVAGASLLPSPTRCRRPIGPARNGSLVYAKDGDIYLADAPDGSDPSPHHWRHHRRSRGSRTTAPTLAFGRGPDSDLAGMVADAMAPMSWSSCLPSCGPSSRPLATSWSRPERWVASWCCPSRTLPAASPSATLTSATSSSGTG